MPIGGLYQLIEAFRQTSPSYEELKAKIRSETLLVRLLVLYKGQHGCDSFICLRSSRFLLEKCTDGNQMKL